MTLLRLSSIGLALARSIDVNMNALKLHRQLHRTPMQPAETALRVELMLFAIWTSVCQRVCAVYLHSLTFLLSAETSLLKAELKIYIFLWDCSVCTENQSECALPGIGEVTLCVILPFLMCTFNVCVVSTRNWELVLGTVMQSNFVSGLSLIYLEIWICTSSFNVSAV